MLDHGNSFNFATENMTEAWWNIWVHSSVQESHWRFSVVGIKDPPWIREPGFIIPGDELLEKQ